MLSRGQKKGFKHTEETKQQISSSMKGKCNLGFLKKVPCSSCGMEMTAANLGKHLPVCLKHQKSEFSHLSIKDMKGWRRKLKQYGLTPETYMDLLKKHNGVCGICGNPNYHDGKALFVDHCHSSGKVRGLLCSRCNIMLGMAKDNSMILRMAADYLDEAFGYFREGSDTAFAIDHDINKPPRNA